jgi:hypothetical protein
MTNLSLINAKRVAEKLIAAGLTVNRMGKRNANRYSLQVTGAVENLQAAVETLLASDKAQVKTTSMGFVRVSVAPVGPQRDAKGHFIKKSA